MTAVCSTCGTEPLQNALFCHGCGSPVGRPEAAAEYKQVTVLFADVVHSMDIAAAVGAERLREIMALIDGARNRRGSAVRGHSRQVHRRRHHGGVRGPSRVGGPCLSGLPGRAGPSDAGEAAGRSTINDRDGVELLLRVGLNSGEVIAGDIGSGAGAYTAIGEQVGMAQRMESAAPPGGVMLSEPTARLVEGVVVLGEPESVTIKGTERPVPARRLLGVTEHRSIGGRDTTLVGRQWELAALTGVLDRAITGSGAVVGLVAPPGVGKSRLVAELAAIAAGRGVSVYSSFCESHANEIPFHAVSRLLRGTFGVDGVADGVDRAQLRERAGRRGRRGSRFFWMIFSASAIQRFRRRTSRRMLAGAGWTALVNGASLGRSTPAVYIVEDVHWIDQVSESLLGGLPRGHSADTVTCADDVQARVPRTAQLDTWVTDDRACPAERFGNGRTHRSRCWGEILRSPR